MRASGEVKGGRASPLRDNNFDYIDLASDADFDTEFGHRRAWVQFNRGDHGADAIWSDMRDTGLKIAQALGGEGSLDAEFSLNKIKQGVGTTFHDAGTLWMGDDPDNSVTDVNGHFYHVTNAYCADQGLFTTVGSANPVLTGVTLARKVAEDIVRRHAGQHAAAPAAVRHSILPAAG
jgi:choline dehydrogenase-like flavoprotein